LFGQPAPRRHRLGRLQLVGPDALEAVGGLRIGQSAGDVRAEPLGDDGDLLAPWLGLRGLGWSSTDDATAP
jgi:hypothetical protein